MPTSCHFPSRSAATARKPASRKSASAVSKPQSKCAGLFLIDLANSLAGWAAGGPAKVAVLSSALQGTVFSSSVANTVSTGSFTIPMMKSLGYEPEFAGAVEAAASTGGQIMPPVMGSAAFLISEICAVPYRDLMLVAIIPAALYFTGIWISVHLEAKRLGLKSLPKEKMPRLWPLMRDKGHLILPLATIIWLMLASFTITRAALAGCLVCVVVPFLRKGTRVPFFRIFTALPQAARSVISVATACSTAGVIIGMVTLTGLGQRIVADITPPYMSSRASPARSVKPRKAASIAERKREIKGSPIREPFISPFSQIACRIGRQGDGTSTRMRVSSSVTRKSQPRRQSGDLR